MAGVDPMKVIASTIRGALVAAPGHELIAVDFAGIESRVTAWMAGEHWKLAAFRKQDREGGPDNYQIAYGDIYGIDPSTVTKKQRQKGKPIDLFGGYEGGVNAFVTMAAVYHVDLEELVNSVWDRIPQSVLDASRALYEKMGKRTTELPERIWLGLDSVKRMWRAKHPATVRLWRDMKDAAVLAVQNPGEVHSIPNKKIMFKVQEHKGKKWLYMRLPSGRRIAYFAPRVEYDTKWCPDCLGHYDVTEREDGSKHRVMKPEFRGMPEAQKPELRCETCYDEVDGFAGCNAGTVPDEYTARVTYMGIDTKTRQWTRVSTYGGKLCLAEGTLVLTRSGWKRIEQCGMSDALWDGEQWVRNDGLAVQGRRAVMNYKGVWLTPDHEVLTNEGWTTAALAQSKGLDGAPVRIPDGYEVQPQRQRQDVLACPMRLRENVRGRRGGIDEISRPEPEELRLPDKSVDCCGPADARTEPHTCVGRLGFHARSLSATISSCLAQLRRARDSGLQALGVLRELLAGHGSYVPTGADVGPGEQRRTLLQEELPVGLAGCAGRQSAHVDLVGHPRRENDSRASGPALQSEEVRVVLPAESRVACGPVVPTYDLLNAGPRRRFTVLGAHGPLVVHNCENAVQAASRDLLVNSMFAVEAKGWPVVMTVHDELVLEVPIGTCTLKEVEETMCELPKWAEGLPVAAEGWVGRRYRK